MVDPHINFDTLLPIFGDVDWILFNAEHLKHSDLPGIPDLARKTCRDLSSQFEPATVYSLRSLLPALPSTEKLSGPDMEDAWRLGGMVVCLDAVGAYSYKKAGLLVDNSLTVDNTTALRYHDLALRYNILNGYTKAAQHACLSFVENGIYNVTPGELVRMTDDLLRPEPPKALDL